MSTAALLIISNVIILFVHASMIFINDSSILDRALKLPTAWGALIGSIVGLSGVAYTAHRGFKNLIAAQEHRAKIEASAREHQHKLDEAKYKREKKDLSITVANAICAELTGLLDKIHQQNDVYRSHIAVLAVAKKEIKGYKTKLIMPKWETPIWNKYVGEIGLFGASITADLISVYSKCATVATTEIPEFDADMAILAYNTLLKTYDPWSKDIIHVTSRLVAFTTGQTDPGPLFFTQHRREERVKSVGHVAAEKLEFQFPTVSAP